MLSSANLKLHHICGYVGLSGGIGGWVGPVACGNRAVDSRHGTGVEGSLHPCTEGHHPSKGFLHLKAPQVNGCTLYNIL
jgi:hypothetical protein